MLRFSPAGVKSEVSQLKYQNWISYARMRTTTAEDGGITLGLAGTANLAAPVGNVPTSADRFHHADLR